MTLDFPIVAYKSNYARKKTIGMTIDIYYKI